MLTKPLSHTLQELHIKLPDFCGYGSFSSCDKNLLPEMKCLHTFTLAKSFRWHETDEWRFVDILTTSNVMPVLRRMNFSVVIDVDDLDRMTNSDVFRDDRHVDLHYAFIIIDDREHFHIDQYVPRGSLSHPRQIVSGTFISEYWPADQTWNNPDGIYSKKPRYRQHLFYTLPWIFNGFFQFNVPDKYISDLQIFSSTFQRNPVVSSYLLKLNIVDIIPSTVSSLPQIISSKRISELHLSQCYTEISVNLPIFDHLIITDSYDLLKSFSFSNNIRSVQIILNYERLCFARNHWTDLQILSTFPFLNSLRILLYGMYDPPNDTSCQILAQTATMVFDFCFCFRHQLYQITDTFDLIHAKYYLFIKQLRNNILALSKNRKPRIVREKDGYGLIVWF